MGAVLKDRASCTVVMRVHLLADCNGYEQDQMLVAWNGSGNKHVIYSFLGNSPASEF